MTTALLALSSTGCLITDPVLPLEEGGNTNPEFFQISPDNDETVFVANSSSPITFKAKATDNETDDDALEFEWSIDNGPAVLGPGLNHTEYTTSGAALGAGIHLVQVFVTDDGLPTGFVDTEWEVQVQ